jgi:XTP/dITP diphosphohydrolase/ATP diphosphatase
MDRTAALAEAIAIMARLRGPAGCPWDREQTFDTIKRHTLEETYEVFDAIERRAWPELKDELGDLLLQVLFYAQMAEEAGYFAIEDVAAGLNAKLIRRHPHIFGDAVAETAAEVNATWEQVKRAEKGGAVDSRYMDAVPRHLPALLEAGKLGARAAKAGFDWQDVEELYGKVEEEVEEIRSAKTDEERFDEVGDLLFTAVNVARYLGVDPEFALRAANRKFRGRMDRVEELAGGMNRVKTHSVQEQEELWRQAKNR